MPTVSFFRKQNCKEQRSLSKDVRVRDGEGCEEALELRVTSRRRRGRRAGAGGVSTRPRPGAARPVGRPPPPQHERTQHGRAAAARAAARGRAAPRRPRRVRRSRHLQVPGAQGGHAQGARAQRPAGAGVRRGHRGPRAAHRQDFLLLLLLGVRLAVPADGRVLQADGHERRPVRPAHRHAPLRRVPVGALLGRAGRPLAQGAHASAGVAGRLGGVHAAAELGAAGGRGVRGAAQRQRLRAGRAALRRRLARAAAPLPRARRRPRRLAAARQRRRQLPARGAPRLGHAAALLHRVQHARHPEDLLPAAAARRHRRVLQRARHHASRLRCHHAAGRGRRQVRAPAHVRLAGLGAGHVLRGHRAGPQHGLQHASVRRPAALREELHHLLRDVLRADGRRAHHRHADPVQVRGGDGGEPGGAACGAHSRGAPAAAAGRAAAAARAGHGRACAARSAPGADQGVRADDSRDARVGDGAASVPEREGGLVPFGRLVHGLRHRPHLHLPLLASAGHRRLTYAIRRGVRHQPHFRDLRVLLQLQAHHADGPREGAVPRAGGQRCALPVHLVVDVAVVGAAVRVRAGRDARRRVGRVLLVHRARRAAHAALVGAGRAAGAAPRAGPRLRRRAGRHRRGAVGHYAHVRRLRAAVRRGAGRLRVRQLPRRRRHDGRGRRRGRRGARRGRGGRARAARRAVQPTAARAVVHAPRRPRAPRQLRRHAELQRSREPRGAGRRARQPAQPVPGGAGRRARLQISVPDAASRRRSAAGARRDEACALFLL